MKQPLLIICLIFVLSHCNNHQQKVAQKASTDSTHTLVYSKPLADSLSNDIDSTAIIHADSIRVYGQLFKVSLDTSFTLHVVKNGDTLVKMRDVPSNISFYDFNSDGFKDIKIEYVSNTPEVQEMLLFDRRAKTFKAVENFADFPAPQRLQGTKYYYSYHKSGCADMNWDSDLFYIQNYKAIRIGNIAGRACNDRDIKDGIYIHRVKGEKKTRIQTLPIITIGRYKDYKWGFIKAYWMKNYKKFV